MSGYSKRKTSSILLRLSKHDFIQIVNRNRGIIDISILAPAQSVLTDLDTIPSDYSSILYEHFTKEDAQTHRVLADKIKKNMEDSLL